MKLAVFLLGVTILAVSAYPATKDDNNFDKASQNDVSVNSVSPRDIDDQKKDLSPSQVSVTASGSVGISSPGDHNPTTSQTPPPPPPPKIRPGNMFARFIDDIFQIPISVLQSVTKLLTNPFVQRKKEGDSS